MSIDRINFKVARDVGSGEFIIDFAEKLKLLDIKCECEFGEDEVHITLSRMEKSE